jgi:hypothetical protein
VWCHCGELTTYSNKSSDPAATVRIRVDGTGLLRFKSGFSDGPSSPELQPIRRWHECKGVHLDGAPTTMPTPLFLRASGRAIDRDRVSFMCAVSFILVNGRMIPCLRTLWEGANSSVTRIDAAHRAVCFR